MSGRVRRRRSGDRAAIIVEAALILPFFVTFVFGIAEYGLMAHTATELNWSARTATLALARDYTGDQIDADILRDVAIEYSGAERAEILGVMVFRARPSGAPTVDCIAALRNLDPTSTTATGVAGRCNVYSGTVVNAVAAATAPSGLTATTVSLGTTAPTFGGSCDGADRFFCPNDREALFAGNQAIGVEIRVRYTSFTGLLPFMSTTLSERAVMLPIT